MHSMNRRLTRPERTPAQTDLAALEREKRESLGQLLLKCARLFNERAMNRANALAEYPPLRPAHTNLFPHIDFAGTRVVELARKVGISKQAVSQTVAELEQLRVVELVQDPTDARAKLVRFTAKGRDAIANGLHILGEIERELEPYVGSDQMRALYEGLRAMESALLLDGLTGAQPQALEKNTNPAGGAEQSKGPTRSTKR